MLALAEVPGQIKQMQFDDHVLQTTEAIPFKYKEGGLVAVFKDGVWSIEDDAAGAAAGSGGFTVDSSVTNQAVIDFFSNRWSTAADSAGNEATYKTFTAGGKTYCLAWYTGDKGDNGQLEDAIKQAHPGVSNFDFEIKSKGDSQSSEAVQEKLSTYLGLGKEIDKVSFTDTGAVKVTLKP